MRNYYPEKLLISQKDKNLIFCVVDANSPLKENMLTLFDLVSDPITGSVESGNAKLIYQDRAVSRNLNAFLGQSLLKQVNFNTKLVLSITGDWKINGDQWLYQDIDNNRVNMKPIFENILKYASSGITLIIGGKTNNLPEMKSQFEQMINQSVNPVQVVFLKDKIWKSNPNQLINSNTIYTETVSFYNLKDILNGDLIQNSKMTNQPVAIYNPYLNIQKVHKDLYTRTEQKLTSAKINESDKNKILDFCHDWRRYNEMNNYLKNNWSLNDLLVRVSDYQQREKGE